MGKRVTVLSGFSTVVLPTPTGPASFSGNQTADLTDAEYAALPTSVTRALAASPSTIAEPVRTGVDVKAIPVTPNTAASGTVTATPGYNAFKLVGATTLALSGFAAGQFSVIRTEFQQDATGSRTLAQPAGVKWIGGSAPTITATASKYDIFEYFSRDGGTTVFGRIVGQNL